MSCFHTLSVHVFGDDEGPVQRISPLVFEVVQTITNKGGLIFRCHDCYSVLDTSESIFLTPWTVYHRSVGIGVMKD